MWLGPHRGVAILWIVASFTASVAHAKEFVKSGRCPEGTFWCQDRCGTDADTCCQTPDGQHNLCGPGLLADTQGYTEYFIRLISVQEQSAVVSDAARTTLIPAIPITAAQTVLVRACRRRKTRIRLLLEESHPRLDREAPS